MSRTIETMERLRGRESWAGPRATVQAWMRGVATVALLTFMTPSPGAAASDWVLRAVLSEDAATVEMALLELGNALYGPFDGQWSVDSVGAWFREDVDLASWFGEVLARGRPEAREAVSEFIVFSIPLYPSPERIEFAAGNHTSAKEMFEGWPLETLPNVFGGDIVASVPTMERLRSREDGGGLLAKLPETVADSEARRLALVFASQMRRVQAALPRLLEEEYDRRQRSGTIGSDEVLDVLLSGLAFLQEEWGAEGTRAAAWAKWVKEREARGLPTEVVGVEAPWNLFGMGIAHYELGESGYPLEGRTLAPGVRRVALALTAEPPAEPGPRNTCRPGPCPPSNGLEAAVALLANERPLAAETGRRIFDLYCGIPVGIRSHTASLDGGCFEKLNLLYRGPDEPSLRSLEADVGRHVVDSLAGLVEETERQCGILAESEADGPKDSPAAGATWTREEGEVEYRVIVPVRERIRSIGEQLQEVLALVGRLDSVSRPVLDGVFEFWSAERFPEARRILEENDWLEPDVAAVSSAQKAGFGAGLSPRRRIGVTELCEGRI